MAIRVLALGFLASAGWGWRARIASRLQAMVTAARTRRLLATMTAHELRDIGIGPAEARMEAARWPWDLRPPRR